MDKNNDTFKRNMCFYMANILHFYIPNSTNEAQIYGPREYETVFRIVSSSFV